MHKVYVVNFSGLTYSRAEEYGELLFMTDGVLDLKKHDLHKQKMEAYIKGSKPTDYLMLSGHSLTCALALTIWFKYHPFCRILVWDNKRMVYSQYNLINDGISDEGKANSQSPS